VPKSADETAEQGENLSDDSDVIELTEEIPAGDSSSKEDASPKATAPETLDASAEDQPAQDEFDALTRDMPEFRVPDQDESSDEEIVELRDRVDPSVVASEAVPSAAILSGRRSSRKDAPAAESADPELEENLSDTIVIDAQQRSEDDAGAPTEQNQDVTEATLDEAPVDEGPVDEAPVDEEPADEDLVAEDTAFDRQEMVKTIQMSAIDRKAFERQVQAEQIDESMLLLDHSHAPDVVVFPPRVLTTRWKEGGPLLREGQVKAPVDEAAAEVEDQTEVEEQAKAEEEAEVEVEASVEVENEIDEASDPQNLTADESEPSDPPEPASEDGGDDPDAAQTLEEEDFPEIEPEAVEIELDSEAIEDASEVKPPPKPAPQASSAKQPQARDASGAQQQPKKPSAKPAKDDDPELSGLVQELLDENKSGRDERKKKAQKPRSPRETWFQKVFTEEYLRTLPKDIHRQTKREVNFIEETFDLDENDRVLDLACGFGRHAIELTRRGHEVAGLDLSMPLLQKALNEAQKQSLSIKFIHGDMRDLSFEGIFSACYLWQTSFGFFDDQTNFRVLRGVHRALKPGGRLLIDVLNRDHIVTKMPHRLWWEGVECVFLEEVDLDHRSSVLHTKRSFIYEDGSPPLEQNTFIRIYSLHELCQLLHAAGFAVREVSGELHHRGRFLGSASGRIIVHAQKRPPRGGRK
jgi:SAM-dependent methyltransferase